MVRRWAGRCQTGAWQRCLRSPPPPPPTSARRRGGQWVDGGGAHVNATKHGCNTPETPMILIEPRYLELPRLPPCVPQPARSRSNCCRPVCRTASPRSSRHVLRTSQRAKQTLAIERCWWCPPTAGAACGETKIGGNWGSERPGTPIRPTAPTPPDTQPRPPQRGRGISPKCHLSSMPHCANIAPAGGPRVNTRGVG